MDNNNKGIGWRDAIALSLAAQRRREDDARKKIAPFLKRSQEIADLNADGWSVISEVSQMSRQAHLPENNIKLTRKRQHSHTKPHTNPTRKTAEQGGNSQLGATYHQTSWSTSSAIPLVRKEQEKRSWYNSTYCDYDYTRPRDYGDANISWQIKQAEKRLEKGLFATMDERGYCNSGWGYIPQERPRRGRYEPSGLYPPTILGNAPNKAIGPTADTLHKPKHVKKEPTPKSWIEYSPDSKELCIDPPTHKLRTSSADVDQLASIPENTTAELNADALTSNNRNTENHADAPIYQKMEEYNAEYNADAYTPGKNTAENNAKDTNQQRTTTINTGEQQHTRDRNLSRRSNMSASSGVTTIFERDSTIFEGFQIELEKEIMSIAMEQKQYNAEEHSEGNEGDQSDSFDNLDINSRGASLRSTLTKMWNLPPRRGSRNRAKINDTINEKQKPNLKNPTALHKGMRTIESEGYESDISAISLTSRKYKISKRQEDEADHTMAMRLTNDMWEESANTSDIPSQYVILQHGYPVLRLRGGGQAMTTSTVTQEKTTTPRKATQKASKKL